MSIPLPSTVCQLLAKNTHPGLQLDKYLDQGDGKQEAQKAAIAKVAGRKGDDELLQSLRARRDAALASLGATTWNMKTAGPLALHLSRASSLENAGICLHPLYGFAFIPGSGLKGLARAYAETIWLGAQGDKAAAWRTIETLFGWAPESDKKKTWKPEGIPKHGADDAAASGSVVFHDAWPTAWPRLIVDIVNNHHGDYYQGTGNDSPPGDWEDPVPVYFLAVDAGQGFELALSARHTGISAELVDLAREWLTSGLVHLGAGGKTNAGYGRFVPTSGKPPVLPATSLESFACVLELVTPAFVAGANQKKEDCELRPATLRGHLR